MTVDMHCKVCCVSYLSVVSSAQCCGGGRPAVEMSAGAASLPGHRPAEPNLLSLHAESH